MFLLVFASNKKFNSAKAKAFAQEHHRFQMVQLVVKIDCVTLPPPPERILEGKEKERTNAHETSEEERERERKSA